MGRFAFSLAAILMVAASQGETRVLNVPANYNTIMTAVIASHNGDTVRVAPGHYVENVNLTNHKIFLASWIIDAGETPYIDSTIIDGDSVDVCVAFDSTNSDGTFVRGFTLTNGYQMFGGGVDVQTDAAPVVSDMKITGNWALQIGAGVYCSWRSTPTFERCRITENYSANRGAGVGIAHESRPLFVNCVISENHADSGDGGGVFTGHGSGHGTFRRTMIVNNHAIRGGGIYEEFTKDVSLLNVTIANNEADTGSAIYLTGSAGDHSEINLVNTILWNPSAPEVEMYYNGVDTGNIVKLSFCDLREGPDSIRLGKHGGVDWGEGNITDDPKFVNADSAIYRLRFDSPCIDAGDPNGPDDPDSTRADMGALYFVSRAYLYGFVRLLSDSSAIAGATVWTTLGDSSSTDSSGYWEISKARVGAFNIGAGLFGYADTLIAGLELGPDDSMEIDFYLTKPEFTLLTQSIEATMANVTYSDAKPVQILNDGNARVTWSAAPHNSGEAGAAPWELRHERSLKYRDAGRAYIRGVVFVDGKFYCLTGTNDSSWVDEFENPDSGRVNTFGLDRAFDSAAVDLEWDGDLVWAASDSQLVGFDFEGNIMNVLDYPGITGVAYDPTVGEYWLSFANNRISRNDHNFGFLEEWNLPNWNVTGLGFRADDPDGYPLYAYHTEEDSLVTMRIDKLNTISHDAISIWSSAWTDNQHPARRSGSAQMTRDYDRFRGWVMVGTAYQERQTSYMEVRQVHEATWWLALDQAAGTIDPGNESDLTLTISRISPVSDTLAAGEYNGEILFTHNGLARQAVVPVTLTVEKPVDVATGSPTIPSIFGITAIRPNPFNATTVISYRLSVVSEATLRLYDISGRLVATLAQGRLEAGEHRAIINGEALASGVYLLKLTAGKEAAVRKVVCVK